ncbi:MAG: S1 RNA-binding domain-containing protein [Bacilli bacterium]|nr:S1 RNA-binding domain-containing protein [Bacilli bacterium]
MNIGDVVKGRITGIKPYGAFVKIDDQIDGLIHISEVSDEFVKNIEDHLTVGEVYDLKIIKISDDNKISLSYRRLHRKGRKKHEDIEITSGFKPFETMLPEWVEKYQKSGK